MTSNPWGTQPRLLAVLGYPIAHSLSPAMHQPALDAAGLNCRYMALAVSADRLGGAVTGLRDLGLLGANVTIPHKEQVAGYLDEITADAALIGAVNTITVREGRLCGSNTDGAGFLAHLRAEGVDPTGRPAAILGAGGAARAIAVALARAGVSRLMVLNRTESRAEAVAAVARLAGCSEARGASPSAAGLAGAALVVNCTPVGMYPQTDRTPVLAEWLPDGAVVYDTVYRPFQTLLLQAAADRGLRTVGGLGMLVYQGALAWEEWFGRRGPVDLMSAAAVRALAER